MVSKAQSQHFLWVTQILTHSWPHLQQPALATAYKPHKAFDLYVCGTQQSISQGTQRWVPNQGAPIPDRIYAHRTKVP